MEDGRWRKCVSEMERKRTNMKQNVYCLIPKKKKTNREDSPPSTLRYPYSTLCKETDRLPACLLCTMVAESESETEAGTEVISQGLFIFKKKNRADRYEKKTTLPYLSE